MPIIDKQEKLCNIKGLHVACNIIIDGYHPAIIKSWTFADGVNVVFRNIAFLNIKLDNPCKFESCAHCECMGNIIKADGCEHCEFHTERPMTLLLCRSCNAFIKMATCTAINTLVDCLSCTAIFTDCAVDLARGLHEGTKFSLIELENCTVINCNMDEVPYNFINICTNCITA